MSYPLFVGASLSNSSQEVGMGKLRLYDTANGAFGSLLINDSAVQFRDTAGNLIAIGGGSGDMLLGTSQTVTGAKTFNNATLLLRNVANTFSAQFTNTNTAARTYTLPDAAGTIALTSDITGTNSGTNTGDQTITLTGAVTGSGTGTFAASLGSFTKSQLDSAVSDGNVLYVGDVTTNATHTGDVTGATSLTIANDAVTYAKIQNVSAATRLIGRGSAGGAGDPEEITLGTGLTMSGTTLSASGGGSGDALVANPLSQFAATTSAQLAGVISDETGTGLLVFATSPTFSTNIILKTSSSGSTEGLSLQNTAGTELGYFRNVFGTARVQASQFNINDDNNYWNTTALRIGYQSFIGFTGTIYGSATAVLSWQSDGVLRIGTTAANALGSLALTNLTASGAVTIGGGTAIAKVLSATATLDFPSIASNDTHALTMTVTGAVAGNSVFVGVPAALDANLVWCASVTAADTVTIRMHNSSGASIDPASGTYRATVFQF